MSKPLVIVESPTKIRTIKKYLGQQYNVSATVGHIRDLPLREIGIDVDKGFTPHYQTIPGKQKVITALKKAAGDTTEVYLAPDPDREGEAIAWHAADVLKKKGRRFHRVLFHELTGPAIRQAMAHPQALNPSKFEAQQTRRILDRLVGYQISPLLWRKVKGGLSAGRVQSVAVRIICERERAIQAFEPQEYWSITARLTPNDLSPADAEAAAFDAKLAKHSAAKIHIPNQEQADRILAELADAAFTVHKIQKKTVRRNPLPPFITSKLQQEAIRKLKFSARKTMQIAQQLYEGVDLGPGEPEGLITYMRTDSTRISKEAAMEALALVRERFGAEFAPEKPRFFKNRKKAQDAHEAIRPTSVYNTPEKLSAFLNPDQLALYRLIWHRFMASQMMPALIDQNTVTIGSGIFDFTASGSRVKFPGFMALYMSVDEETERQSEEKKAALPPLAEAQQLLDTYRAEYERLRAEGAERPKVRTAECAIFGAEGTVALARAQQSGQIEETLRNYAPIEVQALKIGDTCLVGLPGELFTEYALELKRRSPVPVHIASLTGGELQGYIVTPEAALTGGYEATNALFAPEAGQMMLDAALELIKPWA